MSHLAEQIENIRDNYQAAIADGKFTAIEGMLLAGDVGNVVKHLAETFVGDQPHFEQELVSLRSAYQQYIAPIDIPNVPNFLEGWLDQGVIGGLEEGARMLRAKAVANNPELAQGA